MNLENLPDSDQSAAWNVPVDIKIAGKTVRRGENPSAALAFLDRSAAESVLGANDAFVLAEAYVRGLMDIEGDIFAAVSLKDRLYPEEVGLLEKGRIVFNVLKNYRRHSADKDRLYIAHHYEHPDEFYRLFLDRTMTYSCAYFLADDDDLDAAQEQKIDHLLAKLRLSPEDRLLDIGCGWGSLVIRAAELHGVSALGLTLSKTQHAYANRQIREKGLEGRCRVELRDYRFLDNDQRFDKIVSVGMYEHVGSRNLNAYFKKVFELLRPEGLFVNHGITRRRHPDWRKASEALFVDRYIFPGSEIHPASRVMAGMEGAGFEVFDVESLRRHYARTIRHWVARLEANSDEARRIVPEPVYRAWLIYMAGCALTFEEGYLNVHQAVGAKTMDYGGSAIPMTRHHLYKSVS